MYEYTTEFLSCFWIQVLLSGSAFSFGWARIRIMDLVLKILLKTVWIDNRSKTLVLQDFCHTVYRTCTVQCTVYNTVPFLKGVCHEILTSSFFHDSNQSGPLINRLKYFRIWFRFCQDIRIFKTLPGVHPTTESDSAVCFTPQSQLTCQVSVLIRSFTNAISL